MFASLSGNSHESQPDRSASNQPLPDLRSFVMVASIRFETVSSHRFESPVSAIYDLSVTSHLAIEEGKHGTAKGADRSSAWDEL
ncbi:MAG: hypothetical protein NXI32_28515 [bacterium]|nr:hypothetical protein [bacterium]